MILDPSLSARPVGRSAVAGRRCMIATSQPLASAAGFSVLRAGGNAIDAAVAAAAVLNVVEPMMTGIGGDMFALVYSGRDRTLHGLNASGRSPAGLDRGFLEKRGVTEIELTSIHSVTIPGALEGWCALLERFGTRPLSALLEPAIELAEGGFPVAEKTAWRWVGVEPLLKSNAGAAANYLIEGRAPWPGEVHRQPDLARTFRSIGEQGKGAFYEGAIAERIVESCRSQGGAHTVEDFRANRSEWVEPISVEYRGYGIHELPPNGQGLVASLAMNLLKGFPLGTIPYDSADRLHILIEALRLAFADGLEYVADPAFQALPLEDLLSESYAGRRRKEIDLHRAMARAVAGDPVRGSDTTYLAVVDADGNAVSFINSLFHFFGSGHVVDSTGICLQNRGALFSMDPAHRNALEPRKRPYQTIIPGMVTRDGELWLAFGVMGGFMQPQGHVQLLTNMIDYEMGVQEAIEAPRFRLLEPEMKQVALEAPFSAEMRSALRAKGHDLAPESGLFFGGGQAVQLREGVLLGASDPRMDGCALGW